AMKRTSFLAALVLLAAALAGCGGDDCTRAQDQIATCSINSSSSSSSGMMMMAEACAGSTLCRAQCVNQSTCTQINANARASPACPGACQGKCPHPGGGAAARRCP